MDRSIAFYLLTPTRTQDEIGQWTERIEKHLVYGQLGSVTANEFFAAGQNGYKPDFRVVMFGPDYQGEENIEIDGKIYSVYRKYYGRNDNVELYVERRRGDAESGN